VEGYNDFPVQETATDNGEPALELHFLEEDRVQEGFVRSRESVE
jgi:hypothetical protein